MERQAYNIDLTVLNAHNETIDLHAVLKLCDDPWWNKTLTQVNDSVVRVGAFQGEFHWHRHDNEDEFFFVLEGRFFIDLEGRTIELGPWQCTTISKGVMHRPRSPERSVVIMVETKSIVPTGD